MIKRFVIWYIIKKRHGSFRFRNKVVRIFSDDWYDTYIRYIGWGKVREQNKDLTRKFENATDEFSSYICDELCKYPEQKGMSEEEIAEICSKCKASEYINEIVKS